MMIKLESSQLVIIPLTAEQLMLERTCSSVFASALGCPDYIPEDPNEDLQDALLKMIASVQNAPEQWPWNTNWAIIAKEKRAIIGGFCFYGAPQDGKVEIGYGLDQPFRHKGYLSQALSLMIAWAFSHPKVKVIEAETARENLASQRALQRKGFQPYLMEGSNIWWQLTREQV